MNLEQIAAVSHPYHCADENYYSNDAGEDYDTWADFYEEFHDADVDMNLVFRWDIRQREASQRYYAEVFMMHQRKGIFAPIRIKYIDEGDVLSFQKFMAEHWKTLFEMWKPISELNT